MATGTKGKPMKFVKRIEASGCGCEAVDCVPGLVTLDAALEIMADAAAPVAATEQIPLAEATGRILAEAIVAGFDLPRFDNSAMDGYAVDSGSFTGTGPWSFDISQRIAAGVVAEVRLAAGDCARILTGAPLPPGADAVIMQELVERAGDRITVARRPEPGQNIRRAGEEMRTGTEVLGSGTRLGPRAIAAAAACGVASVSVRRRLRVALLVTGDEIRGPGERIGEASIPDINTPMLRAALALPEIELVEVRSAADNLDVIRASIRELAGSADLVVTTGGVSVGEEDHLKPALRDLGARMLFNGVAIKPGKPIGLARLGQAFWLGLPGNPLAAFTTWHIFGRALVDGLSGALARRPRRHVVLAEGLTHRIGRCELRPARIAGFDGSGRELVAFGTATHSAHVARLAETDGFILIPADTQSLPQGALVEFIPLCDDRG